MDMWLDQQNPLTLSPEDVNRHLVGIKKSAKRRKIRDVLQFEAGDVVPVIVNTGKPEVNND